MIRSSIRHHVACGLILALGLAVPQLGLAAPTASLSGRAPLPGAPKLHRVPLPPPLRLRKDVVSLLLEERAPER